MAKKAGLKTVSYFIIGHPYESLQTIRNTINLAKKLSTTKVSFGIMVPYPGTEVYEMAVKGEGNYKLISQRWEDFDKQIGNVLELKNLSRRQLERLQIKGYIAFYFYKLNASFNLHGYPIAGTPEIAIWTFEKSGLDGLAIGNWLVKKK